jgi:hypothetical protein
MSGCATGQKITPATVLTEINAGISALLAAYQAFCLGREEDPKCVALGELIGQRMQVRGQMTQELQSQ